MEGLFFPALFLRILGSLSIFLTLALSCVFRYLVGNQVTGDSSVDAYINALKQGCRCVECKATPLSLL